MINFKIAINLLRLIPHLLFLQKILLNKDAVEDLTIWSRNHNIKGTKLYKFIYLMVQFPEFRNLMYYRLGAVGSFLNLFYPKLSTLFIHTANIGGGLYIQHGFSTIIAAKSIGTHCFINQQVTIGYSNGTDSPVIGNNVKVSAGAKVIGNVFVGNNCKIGANAVVIKNVPDNCTVVGVPGYIIKKDGIRVN